MARQFEMKQSVKKIQMLGSLLMFWRQIPWRPTIENGDQQQKKCWRVLLSSKSRMDE